MKTLNIFKKLITTFGAILFILIGRWASPTTALGLFFAIVGFGALYLTFISKKPHPYIKEILALFSLVFLTLFVAFLFFPSHT